MREIGVEEERLRPLPVPRFFRRRKRGRVPVDALAHENLLVLLTTLRAASADSLFKLFFRPAGVRQRTAMRRLHDLVAAGYLGHVRLEGARCVYHLTAKALGSSARLRLRATSSLATAPQDRQAMYCWLRAALWASLAADGWTIGRSAADVHALRRVLVDAARAALAKDRDNYYLSSALRDLRDSSRLRVDVCDACSRCAWRGPHEKRFACPECNAKAESKIAERVYACTACGERATAVPTEPHTADHKRCAGAWREVDPCAFDIAWRKDIAGSYEAMVLLVDDPSRSVTAQIDELPFTGYAQPRVRMIIRTTDAHSVLDRKTMKWLATGRRRAEFLAAIEKKESDYVEIVEYRRDLQAYFAR